MGTLGHCCSRLSSRRSQMLVRQNKTTTFSILSTATTQIAECKEPPPSSSSSLCTWPHLTTIRGLKCRGSPQAATYSLQPILAKTTGQSKTSSSAAESRFRIQGSNRVSLQTTSRLSLNKPKLVMVHRQIQNRRPNKAIAAGRISSRHELVLLSRTSLRANPRRT